MYMLYASHSKQVISANVNGARDAASRPIDHIALHTMTELDVKCIHQEIASVDIDRTSELCAQKLVT